MQTLEESLYAALKLAGMPEPQQFCVTPMHQEIPQSTLTEIGTFIRIFERVTTRATWQKTVTACAPAIAQYPRSEVCFFSAWDFHLPPEHPSNWQLIEFNDNGSGLLFAGLINRIFYEVSNLNQRQDIMPPPDFSSLSGFVTGIVEAEAKRCFGEIPQGLFLILDDAQSLQKGKFRQELILLRDVWRRWGWQAEVAPPSEMWWNGRQLLWGDREVCFIVNRSTDFFWQAEVFSPLRTAYVEGRVYVAPNPFTYATRSDKRLLEFLSLPKWDRDLGIQPEERAVLSAHVPETHLIEAENLQEIALKKAEFFFKPLYGFAGRGILTGSQVGRSRLRRLLQQGQNYVAQKRVSKSCLQGTDESPCLWTDLRVWAYGGEPFLFSGRASRHPDFLDLAPPGGWLPTYARIQL